MKQVTGSRRYVLAIDLGTSGCKAGLVSLDGEVEGFSFRPVTMHMVGKTGAEQVPEEWWQALTVSVTELLKTTRVDRQAIAAMACSCQGEGTIAVDAHGRALGNALLWMDMRGGPAVRRLAARGIVPRVAGYNAFRLWRWISRTGGAPALSGKDPVGHIAFIRETMPDVYARTHKFLNVPDYLNFRLTGRMVASADSALTSWATDNRDPDAVHYDDALCAQSGLEREKLPDIVRSTDIIGPLLPDVAAALGLAPGIPVVAGAIDNSAAALGSGAVADKALHLYVGTSSWFGAHVPSKKTDLLHQMASVPCALPGRYLMMAMQSAAGANYSFLRDHLLFPDDGLSPPGADADIFPRLDALAASAPPGARGLLYMPWLVGERSPVDNPFLRGGLLNLSLEHRRMDMVRAFLEGVALNTRWMFGAVGRFLGETPAQVNIIGGGAQSDVWCQIFADVLGIAVHQTTAPIQANLRGAAFIAAMGIGEIGAADIAGLVPVRRTFLPRESERGLYAERFDAFLAAYKAVSPFYARLNRVREEA